MCYVIYSDEEHLAENILEVASSENVIDDGPLLEQVFFFCLSFVIYYG